METLMPQTTERGIDLLRLNPAQTSALKKRIARWNGLVRIFVHPMYEKWRGHEAVYIHDPDNTKLVQIEQILRRLIAMPEEKTPPLVVMEEMGFIENFCAWINSVQKIGPENKTYFIATYQDNPRPCNGECSTSDDWERLVRFLKSLGVKKILLGGIELRVHAYKTDWTGKGPFVERCVGIALCYMSKDKAGPFETELSALTDKKFARNHYIELTRKKT